MKNRFLAVSAAMLFVFAAGGELLHAQQSLSAQIPFEFKVGDRSLPAGAYRIEVKSGSQTLYLTNKSSGDQIAVPYLSRISSRADVKSGVVFDKDNGASYLSEVYLGGGDGYYLKGAPGDHSHTALKGTN